MPADPVTCPNCGDAVPVSFAGARMAACESCGSTVFLGRAVPETGPAAGEMHDAPLPAELGETLIVDGDRFDLVGHARFSYGPGWWDEFWALTARGDGVWISVDEGDVALQISAPADHPVRTIRRLPRRGEMVSGWRVSEVEEATCLAVRGSLPDRLRVGDTYRFANLEDGTGGIASADVDETTGALHWSVGRWVDRWQVRRA